MPAGVRRKLCALPAVDPARSIPEPSRLVEGKGQHWMVSRGPDVPSVHLQVSDHTAATLVETLLPGPWTMTVTFTIPTATSLGHSHHPPYFAARVTCNRPLASQVWDLHLLQGPTWAPVRIVHLACVSASPGTLCQMQHPGLCSQAPGSRQSLPHQDLWGSASPEVREAFLPDSLLRFSVAAVYFAICPPWEAGGNLWYLN